MANVLRKSSGASLDLQIPCEARYLDTVRPLSIRIAAYLGYAESEADRVGESIDAVVRRFVSVSPANLPIARVDVTFSTGATAVEIRIRCHGSAADSTRLERDLRKASRPGGALESIRQAMTGVRIGQADGVAFCCLTRDLPDDAP